MGKRVYTSVTLTDPEEGQEVTFGPKDELPGWAVKQLTENWGKHRTDLWGEDEEPDPEQVLIRHQGRPVPADRAHARAQAKAAEDEQKAADEKAAREAGAKAAAKESEPKVSGR